MPAGRRRAGLWPIIAYGLSNERVGIARYEFSLRVLRDMVAALKAQQRFDDPIAKYRAGQAYAACEAARMLGYRVVDQRTQGLPPSADANVARGAVVAADHAVADFGLHFLPDTFTGHDFPCICRITSAPLRRA